MLDVIYQGSLIVGTVAGTPAVAARLAALERDQGGTGELGDRAEKASVDSEGLKEVHASPFSALNPTRSVRSSFTWTSIGRASSGDLKPISKGRLRAPVGSTAPACHPGARGRTQAHAASVMLSDQMGQGPIGPAPRDMAPHPNSRVLCRMKELDSRGPKRTPKERPGQKWSGRRDSNPRHPPWQGGTLPTELLPLCPHTIPQAACALPRWPKYTRKPPPLGQLSGADIPRPGRGAAKARTKWARRDSNPHGSPHRILSPACLPIPPLAPGFSAATMGRPRATSKSRPGNSRPNAARRRSARES